MAGIWTTERKEKSRELALLHRPWERSTGPKTVKGKERSSQNAMKHGRRSELAGLLRAMCMEYEDFRRACEDY